MIYSCKDCQQRYPGCHGKCETYKREKAAHEEERAALNREREIQHGLYMQRSTAVIRATKRRKRNEQKTYE